MRSRRDRVLSATSALATTGLLALLALLVVGGATTATAVAWPRLSAAIAGTVLLCAASLAVALPLGIAAATSITVFGERRHRRQHVDHFLSAMASLPSIVYGLVAAQVLLLAGGLPGYAAAIAALGVMAAPFVYVATREALDAVPADLREAALALGASRWQYLRQVLLPAALPGILTGAVLTVARIAGETAILLILARTIAVAGSGSGSAPPALPYDLFDLLSSPNGLAGSASTYLLVLLAIVVALNATAIYIRAERGRGE